MNREDRDEINEQYAATCKGLQHRVSKNGSHWISKGDEVWYPGALPDYIADTAECWRAEGALVAGGAVVKVVKADEEPPRYRVSVYQFDYDGATHALSCARR